MTGSLPNTDIGLDPMRPSGAVFLDRDGVLISDTGYPNRIDDVRWVRDAAKAVGMLNRLGFLVFVVTNQSGVGRGYFSEKQLREFHTDMGRALARDGARIDAWRYCPHHPEASVPDYRRRCSCRKPAPGMLLDLMRGFALEKSRCLLIGDRESDMQCASNAGIAGWQFTGADCGASLYVFCCEILAKLD